MKVIAVNLGERKQVRWKNKTVETGIFKMPVEKITLGKEDVADDQVIDRKYHGGFDKACYLFSADIYPVFQEKYPKLEWTWGMFGENITVEGLDESKICIGDRYQIGSAIVEVSEPRQPCFKLGIRFKNQGVLKFFIAQEYSGVYVRVLQDGEVKAGDPVSLIEQGSDVSIRDVFRMIFKKDIDPVQKEKAIQLTALANSARKDLMK